MHTQAAIRAKDEESVWQYAQLLQVRDLGLIVFLGRRKVLAYSFVCVYVCLRVCFKALYTKNSRHMRV